MDQTTAGPGSTWIAFGLFPLAPNEDHRVELEGSISYVTGADAIAVSASPIAATWTPELPVTDTYNVYAWWAADASHHPQAVYHIHYAGGTSRVTVNQTQNGGQWNLLGTYPMAPGQNHRVVLAPQIGGKVVADAIKFEATGSGTPRTATWDLPVSSTASYDVYARWAADPANATNATYTVYYSGGTTPVSMNQTQNGGKWNLLGTFTLNPSLNPKVELSDQANGTVVADAVMVVPSGTGSDRVTYTPTLPSAGTFDIYAKWTENGARAEEVKYTVYHGSGSTDITVNQQQPSAGWFRVGTFSMSPVQNHRVEVEGALEGETVADAVRFVSAGTSAPGIQYVHADHLGSPQKMTDASQALVWDAVYTPFGQVHSITGTATNNQRFPGQYADAETGFNYNYFRDYDPTTGRYIESDPIGLSGGLNTFAYVGENPFKWSDPFGLFFPWDHKLASRLAAFEAGCNNIADELGQKTYDQDFAINSQRPDNAYKHAMRDGTLPDQELALADAMAQYNSLLDTTSTDLKALATALHALQDSFSPSHSGFQPWFGPWIGDIPPLSHILGDFLGRYSADFGKAITASVNFLEQAKQRNPCLCESGK